MLPIAKLFQGINADIHLHHPAVAVTTLHPQSPFPTFRNPPIPTLPEALLPILAQDPADLHTNRATTRLRTHLRLPTIRPQLPLLPATVPRLLAATNPVTHLPIHRLLLPATAPHPAAATNRATPLRMHHQSLLQLHPATDPHLEIATPQAILLLIRLRPLIHLLRPRQVMVAHHPEAAAMDLLLDRMDPVLHRWPNRPPIKPVQPKMLKLEQQPKRPNKPLPNSLPKHLKQLNKPRPLSPPNKPRQP